MAESEKNSKNLLTGVDDADIAFMLGLAKKIP